ncbi:MAG: hypothetical protein QXU98_04375 [Candidatus Parvarchaeota archaeon]
MENTPQTQTPAQEGAKDEELDEKIQYLIKLKARTYEKVDYVTFAAKEFLLKGENVPDSLKGIVKSAINVINDTYKEALKHAEEIANAYTKNDMKSVIMNAIEIYAAFNAINEITEGLLVKYTFRYERHGLGNEVDKKLEQIQGIVTYLLDKYVKYYLRTPSELAKMLGDIIDNIEMFYDLFEPDSKDWDYMGNALDDLRAQLEDDENEFTRSEYAILSDTLDIIYNAYGNGITEGEAQRLKVRRFHLGKASDVCDAYEDPERYGILCYTEGDSDDAYKADSINYTELVKSITEAYVDFRTMQIVYKILKDFKIESEEFEANLDDILEKTRDIIETVLDYHIKS